MISTLFKNTYDLNDKGGRMMIRPMTIAVASPYLVGFYFGGLLNSIHKAANELGMKVIVIRTSNERNHLDDPLAFQHVDGFIIVNNKTVHERFIERIHEYNKPIVGIGCEPDKINSAVIAPDNRSGVLKAMQLLIELGHRNIAFVGQMQSYNVDNPIRFLAYKEALALNQIPYNEELLFVTEDDGTVGAENAAKEIMSSSIPITAIFAATDLVAAYLIKTLTKAGYRIPEDIAVFGFDNSDLSITTQPSLSTIDQPIEEIGDLAVKELHKKMQQNIQSESEYIYVSTKLIIRDSCGSVQAGLRPRTLDNRKYKLDHNINEYLNRVILSAEYTGRNLIKASSQEIKNLSWTHSTPIIRWGCLGLWTDDESSSKQLIVTPHYSTPTGSETNIPAEIRCSAEQFPPLEYIPEFVRNSNDGVITLHPIRTEYKDWGVLALYEQVNETSVMYDSSEYCFPLLSSALEMEALHEAVRFNEVKYRSTSEQLEAVIRTTTDGIWDWNLENNQLNFSERLQDMLQLTKLNSEPSLLQMMRVIHPDDRPIVKKSVLDRLIHNIPFQKEIRINTLDGQKLWIYATAEVIRDADGNPIRMIGSIQDVTERKLTEEQITYLAYHDTITSLPNRTLFYDRLEKTIQQSRQANEKFAILLVDLDRFKNINDSYGHQLGDQLLQFIAAQLMKLAYDHITLARLGGDEFVILIPHINDDQEAIKLGTEILELISEPFTYDNFEFIVTGSIGISMYPRDGKDQDTLMKHVDKAMYKAKALGKNTVNLYEHEHENTLKQRINVETALRKALENDEFELFYQPQMDIHTQKVYGIEALIRWNSPERGIVAAAEFINIAEDIGLIVPMGEWVLKEACRQSKHWQDQGCEPFIMSVNISPYQFNQADFVQRVKDILSETKLDPKWLCLEITESTAIQNIELSGEMLEQLKQLGVSISMDDFGMGYSSLALLKRLPIDYVKIDKSFVREMTEDEDDQAIVNAIIAMSHSLKLQVVAEGVESKEQIHLLKKLKCNFIQGYYMSKPIAAHLLEGRFLKKQPMANRRNHYE